MSTEEKMKWIWVAERWCGCVAAASVDDQPVEELQRDIGDWVMRGYKISHRQGRVTLGNCLFHRLLRKVKV